jgi:hypothetical protein
MEQIFEDGEVAALRERIPSQTWRGDEEVHSQPLPKETPRGKTSRRLKDSLWNSRPNVVIHDRSRLTLHVRR